MSLPDGGDAELALLDAYDFDLPEASIAQTALPERDQSRLMLLDRETGERIDPTSDTRVRDLPRWLRPGDLLVVNTTRVLAARLVGHKRSGGTAEALLLGPEGPEPGRYRALVKCTGRLREGLEFVFGERAPLPAQVVALHGRGEVSLVFPAGVDPYSEGRAPLPPYIRREATLDPAPDLARYQTIYAREPGAVAAPTAGLHFTPALFEALDSIGVKRAEVVLHVGAGTFRPLDAQALASGELHEEAYFLPEETVEAVAQTRRNGGRVIAVGTTSARVLESCADARGELTAGRGTTRLFLRPGGRGFRVVDGLLTNFHLPRSSLLLLVATLVGRDALLAAYRQAIETGFRFYSYGDAMLIAPGLNSSPAPVPENDDTASDLETGARHERKIAK